MSSDSHNCGGKVTAGRIYPDNELIDEYGRTIELEYPATAIINRTVAGIPWEIAITSFGLQLEHKVRNNEITKKKCFEFVTKFYEILQLSEEWQYTGFNEDDLWEYLQEHPLRIMDLPYSNELSLEIHGKLCRLAEEYIDYRKLTIYRRIGKDKYQALTDKHVVGRMFNIRDYHDTEHGNSSSSEVEKNSQGFANNKDNSKKTGKSIYAKKGVKMDVQFQHLALNIATNPDATVMLADPNDESAYGITEVAEASGIKIQLGTNKENFESLFDEEEEF